MCFERTDIENVPALPQHSGQLLRPTGRERAARRERYHLHATRLDVQVPLDLILGERRIGEDTIRDAGGEFERLLLRSALARVRVRKRKWYDVVHRHHVARGAAEKRAVPRMPRDVGSARHAGRHAERIRT